MARSSDKTDDIQYLCLIAVAIFAFLVGFTTQSFIILVNLLDCLKRKLLTPIDQILLSLGLVRVCLLIFSLAEMSLILFVQNFMFSPLSIFFYLMVNSCNLSSIWLTTVFSVVFCMKIANFHNALFLRLKIALSKQVVRLILGSILLSICYISLFMWIDHNIKVNLPPPHNLTSNGTFEPPEIHVYVFVAMGNSVPMIIYSTSTVLLIVSLLLHLKKMKSNANVTASLDTYYEAIKFMSFCLLCFVLLMSANVVVLQYYYCLDIIAFFTIWNTFPTLHSIYLIYRTNKLREHFLKILQPCTSCVRSG